MEQPMFISIAKHLRLATACAALVATGAAVGQSNEPFDFSYNVSGSPDLRPSLIFSDGANVFIQPASTQQGLRVLGAQSTQQGPYIVVKGTPSEFTLTNAKQQRAVVRYVGLQDTRPDVEQNVATHTPTPAAAPASVSRESVNPFQAPVKNEIKPATDHLDGPSQASAASSCANDYLTSSSNVAIQFNGSTTSLSNSARDKLRENFVKQGFIKAVVRSAPDESSKVRSSRSLSIGKALADIGAVKGQIENGGSSGMDGLYEVQFDYRKSLPCVRGDLIVSENNGRITVVAKNAEVRDLIEQIASKLDRRFAIEGDPRAQQIDIQFASVPSLQALAKIGDALSGGTTMILRDRDLVLKYK